MEAGVRTAVDPLALRAAAQRVDAAADSLYAALAVHLRPLNLDAPAGLRDAVQRLVADVDLWQRAARETAVALRTAADRYADTDALAAEALR